MNSCEECLDSVSMNIFSILSVLKIHPFVPTNQSIKSTTLIPCAQFLRPKPASNIFYNQKSDSKLFPLKHAFVHHHTKNNQSKLFLSPMLVPTQLECTFIGYSQNILLFSPKGFLYNILI